MKPQDRICVRRAQGGDLDAVAALWHESASRMDGAPAVMPPLRDLRERIDRELAAGWDLYVAERGGDIVGMLAIKPREAVLDQIFVLPGEQGRGVGASLVEWARRAMPDGFTLRMAAANRRAANFYERAGLRAVGEGTHPVSGEPVRFFGSTG